MQSTSFEPTASESSIVRTGRDGRLCFKPNQRQALLDAFETSSLSAMAFAKQHGIKYQTFIAWRRKRRERAEGAGRSADQTFAEVLVREPRPSSQESALRVRLPCGTIIEVPSRSALPLVVELISALRRTC